MVIGLKLIECKLRVWRARSGLNVEKDEGWGLNDCT